VSGSGRSRSAVVLGARNLGGAIAARLLAGGWQVGAVARSDDTLARAAELGAVALRADASDPASLARALAEAAERHGGLDLVVNAVTASRPPREGGPFGGGPLADADVEAFRGWAAAVAEQAFVFLSEGAKALRASGRGGTLIQVTGGSARRAMPGKGLWAAGAFATRALVQAAAQELRAEGIHVALLVVDATIESPKTAATTRDVPREALADQDELAAAIEYLAGQSARGLTHELQVTPAGDRWVP
jgi:NAD(P)-dependent dehydrogenase (short-subunit alcohol dehydrogenase family)